MAIEEDDAVWAQVYGGPQVARGTGPDGKTSVECLLLGRICDTELFKIVDKRGGQIIATPEEVFVALKLMMAGEYEVTATRVVKTPKLALVAANG